MGFPGCGASTGRCQQYSGACIYHYYQYGRSGCPCKDHREPADDLLIEVKARRVRCLRTNEEKDFGEHTAVMGEQYAILLESDVPVVAQYGRAETRTVTFYTTPGYACEK